MSISYPSQISQKAGFEPSKNIFSNWLRYRAGASNYDECAANYGYDAGNRPILYHPLIRIRKSNVSLHNMDSKHS